MGSYTQFKIHAELKEETPKSIIECVKKMISDDSTKEEEKNFIFRFKRNPFINYGMSGLNKRSFKNLILIAHGDIKNYWSDIERFVEFIKPWIKRGFLKNGSFAKDLYIESEHWNYHY